MTFVTGIERRALARGLAEGEAKGEAKGKAEGMAEGEAKGKAETVARLARKRLGEPSEAAAAWFARFVTETDLDALLDRLLVVESWEELLAGAGPGGTNA